MGAKGVWAPFFSVLMVEIGKILGKNRWKIGEKSGKFCEKKKQGKRILSTTLSNNIRFCIKLFVFTLYRNLISEN